MAINEYRRRGRHALTNYIHVPNSRPRRRSSGEPRPTKELTVREGPLLRPGLLGLTSEPRPRSRLGASRVRGTAILSAGL